MITIEMLDARDVSLEPQEWMSSYAKKEFSVLDIKAVERVCFSSEYIFSARKDDRQLALLGTYRGSLIGKVRLWFILAERLGLSDLKEGKNCGEYLLSYYPRVETTVETTYRAGIRFARFCGFSATPEIISVNDKKCQVYEVRR